jgi:tetratricopeptide (TPR) repeat protein
MNAMRLPIILLLTALLNALSVCAQKEAQQLSAFYNAKQYRAAIAEAKKLLFDGSNVAVANLIAGRSYADMEEYDSSISYLAEAIRLDGDRGYVSGWAHAYLGHALIKTNMRDSGIAELKTSIRLNKTENSTKYARHILLSTIDVNEISDRLHLLKVESAWMTYYFQDTGKLAVIVSQYIGRHDSAYRVLSHIFNPRLPAKPAFYVFTNQRKAERALGRTLGFSLPEEARCFSMQDQTLGHELTHVLSYWAYGRKTANLSRFIDEGISVCFDLTHRDVYATAGTAIKNNSFRKSVTDLWAASRNYPDELTYAVGGAFVRYIYTTVSAADFQTFVKDQTETRLKSILKDDYDSFIARFDAKVGK